MIHNKEDLTVMLSMLDACMTTLREIGIWSVKTSEMCTERGEKHWGKSCVV